MKFVIVTGLSGAGKTQALRRMEDIGFFCVDNLPLSMLESFMELCRDDESIDKAAVVVDSRAGEKLKGIHKLIKEFKEDGFEFDILFLDAQDASLIRRFKATHRVHPIKGCTLIEGISAERKMLARLKELSGHVVDTTNLSSNQLSKIIDEMYGDHMLQSEDILIFVNTFGFKRGIPLDADLVFDVRFLPNPYYVETLKLLSGENEAIQRYILDFPQTQEFLDKLYEMVAFLAPLNKKSGKDQLKIAIGCTGGMHRSVAVAEMLNQRLITEGYHVILSHRDINKDGTTKI